MRQSTKTLDPPDWNYFRQQAHQMLDDMLTHLETIRNQPVWLPAPDEIRSRFRGTLPRHPADLRDIHHAFLHDILPYGSGNAHPGFLGWVQGGGTPVGMLAEMLAAGMNANLGGRDHIPVEVERQVVAWMREIFRFPEGSAGLFLTGTSMANLIAVIVARDTAQNQTNPGKLTAYASVAVHGCIAKAMHASGIGRDSLRLIRTDNHHRIDVPELERVIESDRRAGFTPFLVVGTAGTVDIGAIDNLAALADLCRRQNTWFHVDGAYAALAILSPDLAPLLSGIERADSLAFDFHKWGQVPYPAGFLLVRHGVLHRQSFSNSDTYLRRETRGLAAGENWPCDFGIDLSRGFQALKTWFTFKVFGTDAIAAAISQTCRLARYLEQQIAAATELDLMAPVQLNIVCFRIRPGSDQINARIVVELQESGELAPSTTSINGHLVIRAAIVNHRTTQAELDLLLERTVGIGKSLLSECITPQNFEDGWPPWQLKQALLGDVDRQLAASPNSIDLSLKRAALLSDLGLISEARGQYLQVLARDPSHPVALNNIGTLLYGTGYRTAAHTAYAEAVARHPSDVTSLVNLANVLLDEGNARAAREQYAAALRLKSSHADAHQGMARALAELGDEHQAEIHRQLGYANNALAALPYRGRKSPLDLLLLVSAKGGNIPIRHILDDTTFRTFVLTADYYNSCDPLPSHRVVFNSIGDADLAQQALASAESVLIRTAAPVLNQPSAVRATGRADNARRLRSIPGVVTPLTVILPRQCLEGPEGPHTLALHGFHFPLLLRAPGFHTGRHFVKVEQPDDLLSTLAEIPGKHVTVIQYLDARARDGKSRKYRVMMIDGQLYPLHVAISSQWKIHYFTAEMAESTEHRAEDAAFLEDMPSVLGSSVITALTQIQTALMLDYAGIDFGLNGNGQLLLFEANATMVVMRPEPHEQWAYRKPAVERIHDVVRKMLIRSSQSPSDPAKSPGSEARLSYTNS